MNWRQQHPQTFRMQEARTSLAMPPLHSTCHPPLADLPPEFLTNMPAHLPGYQSKLLPPRTPMKALAGGLLQAPECVRQRVRRWRWHYQRCNTISLCTHASLGRPTAAVHQLLPDMSRWEPATACSCLPACQSSAAACPATARGTGVGQRHDCHEGSSCRSEQLGKSSAAQSARPPARALHVASCEVVGWHELLNT